MQVPEHPIALLLTLLPVLSRTAPIVRGHLPSQQSYPTRPPVACEYSMPRPWALCVRGGAPGLGQLCVEKGRETGPTSTAAPWKGSVCARWRVVSGWYSIVVHSV